MSDQAFLEKIKTIGYSIKAPLKATRNHMKNHDYHALCRDKESPVGQLTKDPIAFRHIREGNASDKALKRDAEVLQRTHQAKVDYALKAPKLNRIKELKENYKRKYRCEPL